MARIENNGDYAISVRDEQIRFQDLGYEVGQFELKYFRKIENDTLGMDLKEVLPQEALEYVWDEGYSKYDHDDEMQIHLKEGFIAKQRRTWKVVVPGAIINHLLRAASAETLSSANIVIQGTSFKLAELVAGKSKASRILGETLIPMRGEYSIASGELGSDNSMLGSLKEECSSQYLATVEALEILNEMNESDLLNSAYTCVETDSGAFELEWELDIQMLNFKVK